MSSQVQSRQLLDASTKDSLKNSAVQLPVGGAGQGLKPIRPWGFPRCGRDTGFALWRHPPPLIPQRRSRPSPVPSLPPSPVARLNLFLLQNPRSSAISLRHHRLLHLPLLPPLCVFLCPRQKRQQHCSIDCACTALVPGLRCRDLRSFSLSSPSPPRRRISRRTQQNNESLR